MNTYSEVLTRYIGINGELKSLNGIWWLIVGKPGGTTSISAVGKDYVVLHSKLYGPRIIMPLALFMISEQGELMPLSFAPAT